MTIHWTPCYDNRPISRTQPEPDRLVIKHRGKVIAIDFSDEAIVEYELEEPVSNYVSRAWRVAGVLHLLMPSYDRLKADVVIDHGEQEAITWRTG